MGIRKTFGIALVGGALGLLAGCSSGRQAGIAAAQRDIAMGHLELRVYGMRAHAESVYPQLLEERIGVKWNPVADCVVTEQLVEKSDAYNEVMKQEIERRFGVGILERLEREAQVRNIAVPTTQVN